MKKSLSLLHLISIFFAGTGIGWAGPCEGIGTEVFYINGMYNTSVEARMGMEALKANLSSSLTASEKKVRWSQSYNENEGPFLTLLQVAEQKQIDDISMIWFWMDGYASPSWFTEAKQKVERAWHDELVTHDLDLREFLEQYSDSVVNGYNVLLISHSQGNFYANQVLRTIDDYPSEHWQGSWRDKRREKHHFPVKQALIRNVQLATPVNTTVDQSPYLTRLDDIPMLTVRDTAGALPANIKGGNSQDPLGHNLIKAYVNDSAVLLQLTRLVGKAMLDMKYPVPYFAKAMVLEHDYDASLDLAIHFEFPGAGSAEGYSEATDGRGIRQDYGFLSCWNLEYRNYPVQVRATGNGEQEVRIYPGSNEHSQRKPRKSLWIRHARFKQERYNLGAIEVVPHPSGRDAFQLRSSTHLQR